MKILCNAFSLQMLDLSKASKVSIEPIDAPELKEGEFVSAVGHADTANVLTSTLGVEVPCNRVSVKLEEGTELIVAQIVGGRLPEGSTTLPEGFKFQFVRVTLQ